MVLFVGTFVGMAPLAMLPAPEIIDLFELHRHPYAHTQHNDGHILYRLFVPRHIEPGQTYPLIVWLHGYGAGEFYEIDHGHLRHTQHVITSVKDAERFDFYLLAVQCPPDQQGFYVEPTVSLASADTNSARTPGDATLEIISQLLQENPIEPNQITLVGISGGGTDALEMAAQAAALFAGVAPLGCSGFDTSRIAELQEIPVWAFHSASDSKTPADGIARTVAALDDAGGTADLTLVPGSNHDCWRLAFEKHGLLAWLLAQDRRADSFARWLAAILALTMLLLAGGIAVCKFRHRGIL